ncbi:hypothetical protein M2161_008500 [Streptomyces sp. SAI-133]|nr:hypothetical protein [Streptomyces sp. SAI-133]
MKASSCPTPASCTIIIGISDSRVTTHAVMRTARPGTRRLSASPMVNRPVLCRGSASRNISSSSDSSVLSARTTPSKPHSAMTPPMVRTVAAEM